MTDYVLLAKQLLGFSETDPHFVPLFANASALLFETLEDISWAGFYTLHGDTLVLGPFQGKTACIHINTARGVCGKAVRDDSIQRIANVHEFPGHIACDCASNSEIVIPVHKNGEIVAVLDIDSTSFDRFTADDERGLLDFVSAIEKDLEI